MTIRRSNPRHQGDIGLGAAIAWFAEQGYVIFVPLSESRPFDLVVQSEAGLQRVQVKTTTCLNLRGRFVVDLRTNGGNRSRHTSRPFDPTDCDLLFVLTDDGSRYLIPSDQMAARTQLVIGADKDRYRV